MSRDVLAVVEPDNSRASKLVFSIADGLRHYRDFGVTPARVGAEVLHVHATGETRIAVSVPAPQGNTAWNVSPYLLPISSLSLHANFGFSEGDQVVMVEP